MKTIVLNEEDFKKLISGTNIALQDIGYHRMAEIYDEAWEEFQKRQREKNETNQK